MRVLGNRRFGVHYVGALLGILAAGCSDESTDESTVPILFGATISRTGVSAVGTWESALGLAAADAAEGLAEADYPTGKRLDFKTRVADTVNNTENTVSKGQDLVADVTKHREVLKKLDTYGTNALDDTELQIAPTEN
jgi:hypothetical protein